MSSRTSLDEVTRRHNLRSTLAPHLERRESSLTSTTLPKSSLSPSLDDSDVEVASPTETRPHSKQMTQGESASQRPNRQRPKKERHYLISASAALHYIDQHYAGKNLNVPVSQVAGEIAQDCTMKYYDMSKKRFSTRKGRQVYDLLYQIAEQSDVTTKGLVESGTQLASDDLLGKIKEELAMSEMSDEEHTGEDSNASSDASSNAARLTKSRPDSRRQPLSLNHSTKVSTPPAVPSTSSRANANGYSLRKRSGTPTSFVSSGNKHKRCRNGKQRSSDERPAQVFNTQEERTQASQDVNSVEQVSVNGSSTQPSPVQPSIGAPPTTRATYTLGRNESDSVVEANQNVDPAFINILSRLTRARDLQLINLDKLRYDQVLDGLALLAKQNVGSNAGGTSSPQASLSSATIDLDATTHDMPTGPPLSHVSTTDFDFFGTYGEHVAGRLSNIYSAVVSITYEQLLAMKVNLKQRARFVFVPEPRLGALYKQIAGQGIARRRVALIEENITCSGLITSLIGAFLHSQVFLGAAVPTADAFIEAGNRWLGPFRRSYERQLAESDLSHDALFRRAYLGGVQMPAFIEKELNTTIDALAKDLTRTLQAHLQAQRDEPSTSQTCSEPSAMLSSQKLGLFIKDALSLKCELSSARQPYRFTWPAPGQPYSSGSMEAKQGSGKEVVLSLFPGLTVEIDGKDESCSKAFVHL